MQIEWTSKAENPFLFRQQSEWTGIRVRRARVLPGRMLEHAPSFHEINMTLAGKAPTTHKISGNGRLVCTHATTGNFCLTPAGQSVSAAWEEPMDNLAIELDPQFVKETAVENQLRPDFEFVEIYEAEDPLLAQLGLALLDESSSDSPSGKLYADSLIQTLTLHLLNSYTSARSHVKLLNGGLAGYKLRRVESFIDAHLDRDLGLADLSAVAELSQFHFARAFRKSTGLTPQQYLRQRRIERAKQLLADDRLSLIEVSLRTGFKNQSHFTALFRKSTRVTPKAWRELALS